MGARLLPRPLRPVRLLEADELEFSFEWWQDDLLRVRLDSVMVGSWEIESNSQKEDLRMAFNDERVKFCEVQLKPYVQIEWSMTW